MHCVAETKCSDEGRKQYVENQIASTFVSVLGKETRNSLLHLNATLKCQLLQTICLLGIYAHFIRTTFLVYSINAIFANSLRIINFPIVIE